MFSCPSIKKKLRSAQAAEYGPYTDYSQHPDAPLPEKETKTTMSYYAVLIDQMLFTSYLPGHLRKRSNSYKKGRAK